MKGLENKNNINKFTTRKFIIIAVSFIAICIVCKLYLTHLSYTSTLDNYFNLI